MANVIYTVVGEEFQDWARNRVEARNEKVKKEKEMLVELDPEILDIFNASTSVSGKFKILLTGAFSFSTLLFL